MTDSRCPSCTRVLTRLGRAERAKLSMTGSSRTSSLRSAASTLSIPHNLRKSSATEGFNGAGNYATTDADVSSPTGRPCSHSTAKTASWSESSRCSTTSSECPAVVNVRTESADRRPIASDAGRSWAPQATVSHSRGRSRPTSEAVRVGAPVTVLRRRLPADQLTGLAVGRRSASIIATDPACWDGGLPTRKSCSELSLVDHPC